jgi:hypothetical protein
MVFAGMRAAGAWGEWSVGALKSAFWRSRRAFALLIIAVKPANLLEVGKRKHGDVKDQLTSFSS